MFGFDFVSLITTAGYFGIALSITVESGLLFGFLFPGDSLLFTVGLLAAEDVFNIWILLPLLIFCAFFGDLAGYLIGQAIGPRLFSKKETLLFKPKYVESAHQFFLKYGAQAIFFARFTPIVRSIIPIIAGVARMPYRGFLFYNILGAFVWAGGITLIGYFLGLQFPQTEDYLIPIIALIIVLSLIPAAVEYVKTTRKKKEEVKSEEH